jgi:TusA-related sulfurtransferase
MREMHAGQVLHVVATDPTTQRDLQTSADSWAISC